MSTLQCNKLKIASKQIMKEVKTGKGVKRKERERERERERVKEKQDIKWRIKKKRK